MQCAENYRQKDTRATASKSASWIFEKIIFKMIHYRFYIGEIISSYSTNIEDINLNGIFIISNLSNLELPLNFAVKYADNIMWNT